MKILITGGLGNLGAWMTRHFLAVGEEVAVLSRSDRELRGVNGYRHISCDITSLKDCRMMLGRERFDVVIHLASLNDTFVANYAERALMANALGTRNLLETTVWGGLKRFIYFSTFHVYGRSDGFLDETAPVLPRHDYATTHFFAEEYIRQFHRKSSFPYAILRLTNGYGSPVDPNTDKWYLTLNDLAKMAFEEGVIRLKGNGLAQRDFVWMGDVVRGVQAIANSDAFFSDAYNMGSEVALRLRDVADLVADAYGAYSGLRPSVELNKEDTSRHKGSLEVSCEKLRAKIPWAPSDRLEDEALNVFRLLAAKSVRE